MQSNVRRTGRQLAGIALPMVLNAHLAYPLIDEQYGVTVARRNGEAITASAAETCEPELTKEEARGGCKRVAVEVV
jgi:hypothetical protein